MPSTTTGWPMAAEIWAASACRTVSLVKTERTQRAPATDTTASSARIPSTTRFSMGPDGSTPSEVEGLVLSEVEGLVRGELRRPVEEDAKRLGPHRGHGQAEEEALAVGGGPVLLDNGADDRQGSPEQAPRRCDVDTIVGGVDLDRV